MRVSLKKKLLFLVLLPHLAIVGLAGEAIWNQAGFKSSLESLAPLTEIATSASHVIHEFQKERGLTVGLITSDYAPSNQTKLGGQRGLSDEVLSKYRGISTSIDHSALPERLQKVLKLVDIHVAELSRHRDLVDKRDMTVSKNVRFYTRIIVDLIELISITAERSPSPEITSILLPYLSLVEAKEHSGLERAIGAAVLNAAEQGKFQRKLYESYLYRLNGESLFLKQFQWFASDEQRQLFDSTVKGPIVDQVLQWRAVLAQLPETKDTKGVAGSAWFAAATKRINLFKAVEDNLAVQIKALTTQKIDEATNQIFLIASVNIVIVLIFAGIGISGALPITNRIGRFVVAMKALAAGQRPEMIQDDRLDDIGDMNRALIQFDANIEQGKRDQEERSRFEREAAENQSQALRSMADAVEGELSKTVSSISKEGNVLASNARDLSGISGEVSGSAQAVAAAAEEATANASTVAMLVEKVNVALDDVAKKVATTRSSADEASEAAKESTDVVSRLEEAAAEVGKVVGLITEVAEQTNLLALNATIEAARAGEAGKGFAVVASEVKSLATQTTSSAAEIANQVESMQSRTADAVSAMSKISSSISSIAEASVAIDQAVHEQKAAAGEIASNASQSSEGSQEVSARIAEVTSTLLQLDQVSQHLTSASETLRSDIDNLRSGIRQIVRTSSPEVDQRELDRRIEQVNVEEERRTGDDRRTA